MIFVCIIFLLVFRLCVRRHAITAENKTIVQNILLRTNITCYEVKHTSQDFYISEYFQNAAKYWQLQQNITKSSKIFSCQYILRNRMVLQSYG